MGRSAFARNNALWMSVVGTLLGILLTVLAFTHGGTPAGWNAAYERLVPSTPGEDWNLAVQILAPVLLLTGVWYAVEQIQARRTFNEIVGLEKKSEFNQRLPELKEEVKKLPKSYEEQLEDKEESFRSRRRK